MTSLSGIKIPFPRTVSPVNATSFMAYDSEMRVTTGRATSLAKPFLFLQSSHLRFGCRLVGWSSDASLGVGVGAAMGTNDGAAGGDGECRLEGKTTGRLLVSSSQVEVAISSSRHRPGHVAGAGNMRGGNIL